MIAIICYVAVSYFSHRASLLPARPELYSLDQLSVVFLFVVVATVFWLSYVIARRSVFKATTKWWSPSRKGPTAPLEWDDVYGLVAYRSKLDPLNVVSRIRWKLWLQDLAFVQAPSHLALATLGIVAANSIIGKNAEISNADSENTVSGGISWLLSLPVTYLAFFLSCTAIFFAFRQIRAKVLASSRQEWIIRARTLIGEVVALTDTHRDLLDRNLMREARECWTRLNSKRLELELMLNPSEKDHRLLLYLIQKFASWRHPTVVVQDAANVEKDIKSERAKGANPVSKITASQWELILEPSDREASVSYILRLSHAVLKREWERVKLTR